MKGKTYTAVSVEDAITMATMDLGIPSSDLEYEVIDKGSRGFLGIGARQAIINAWRKVEAEEEKKPAETEKKAPEAVKRAEKPQKNREKPQVKPEQKEERKDSRKEEPKKDPKKEKKAEKKEIRPEKKEVKPVREAKPVKEASAPAETKKEETPKVKTTENDAKHFEEGKAFLIDVFDKMGMKVQIDYAYDAEENALEMNLSGDEMGVLIGKRGQTLDSLQYLTSLVVNRSGEHYIRVKLDTENYRERRKETLEALAKNIAYKVKRTRKSVSLEPMNPYERRIIHAALQQDNFVMTKSEGEEPYRHVVVFYRRNRNGEER